MSNSVRPLVLSGVIGDVVDNFEPSVPMSVRYGNKDVSNAYEFKPSIAIDAPTVRIGGNPHDRFTLVMTDPDAPSPNNPTMRELVHWIVVNIPGGTSPENGEVVLPYISPRPHLGIHRFAFLLFQQPHAFNRVDQPQVHNFVTRTFANSLGLGLPVAAVHFNARKEPNYQRSRRQ